MTFDEWWIDAQGWGENSLSKMVGRAAWNAATNQLLHIARELAARHVRGKGACTACGAAAYTVQWMLVHNEGCPVL